MARRSSYASVLAGSSSAQRSGFISNNTSGISPPAHARSTSVSAATSHEQLPQSRSYSGPHHTLDTFDREPLPPYSSSMGKYTEILGGSMMESRTSVFTTPSYLRHSRHVERLEAKYKNRLKMQRDEGRRTSTGGMSRSSSGVNLHKMVPSHRGMTYEIQEKYVPNTEDMVADLPTRWSSHDKHPGIEVSGFGCEVKFTGSFKNPSSEEVAAAIRTDHPIPRACGMYYFEATIVSKSKDASIGIGLSSAKSSLHRQPGWEAESYAYHGDDGRLFSQTPPGREWGPRFGYADIIGCGINFKTNTMFFTKNGNHIGNAFGDVKGDKLYPTVGLKKPGEHVKINLGATPFVYDIDGMVNREREKLFQQIDADDPSNLHTNETQNAFLQRLVGQYLAHEGYTESTKIFAEEVKTTRSLLHGAQAAATNAFEYTEDFDAVIRQTIRAAILEGDVDKALKYTMAYYPSVLQDNENIYFKLRCRKFIEMIKRTTDLQPRSKRTSVHSLRRQSSRSIGGYTSGTNGHYQTYWEEQPDVFSGQMELDSPSTTLPNAAYETAIADDSAFPLPADTLSKQADFMASAVSYGRELQREFKDDPRREVKQALEDTFALIAYPDARDSSLAHLLEAEGRAPVAEELNSAILVSLGQSSNAAIERLIAQTEALTQEISSDGSGAALLNVRKDFLR